MAAPKTKRPRGTTDVVAVLKETLSARGAEQWLRANNRLLDGHRPIDLLAKGKTEAVREAAKAYVEGSYV